MKPSDQQFVLLLTGAQNRLFGYLVNLLGNLHDARDVLQETNIVLWEKMGEFEPGTNFNAWAHKCAYWQALAFIRSRKRDRHVFDEALMADLARDASDLNAVIGDEDERELALRDCLACLPHNQREMIQARYFEDGSTRDVAKKIGKKESAVRVALMRTRHALLACIESKLEALPQ